MIAIIDSLLNKSWLFHLHVTTISFFLLTRELDIKGDSQKVITQLRIEKRIDHTMLMHTFTITIHNITVIKSELPITNNKWS